MSIIKSILKDEYDRLNQLCEIYGQDIQQYPKGALSFKAIKGHIYAYLAYREQKKVKFKYIGPKDSEKVAEMEKQIVARKKLESELKKIESDLKELGHAF